MADDDAATLVVCDAGPLIHLDELGCIDLLSDFEEVRVPDTNAASFRFPTNLSDFGWFASALLVQLVWMSLVCGVGLSLGGRRAPSPRRRVRRCPF